MNAQKIKEIVRLLRILSFGLIGSVVFLLLMALILLSISGNPLAGEDEKLSRIMFLVLLFLGLWGIAGGQYLFRKRMRNLTATDPIEVLDRYRGAMIVRLALLESAAFFGVITYLLLGDERGLLVALALLLFMVLLHPTRLRILKESGIDVESFVD
jgi:hypothetical protein